jgi:hypothetical protein
MDETKIPDLTAGNLKDALWETLHGIKSNMIPPSHGDAIASQAREILRTVKVQLQISNQTKRSVPAEVITFSEK